MKNFAENFFFKKKKQLFFRFQKKKNKRFGKTKKTSPLAKTKHKTIAKTNIHRTPCNKTQNPFQKKTKLLAKKKTQNV